MNTSTKRTIGAAVIGAGVGGLLASVLVDRSVDSVDNRVVTLEPGQVLICDEPLVLERDASTTTVVVDGNC